MKNLERNLSLLLLILIVGVSIFSIPVKANQVNTLPQIQYIIAETIEVKLPAFFSMWYTDSQFIH